MLAIQAKVGNAAVSSVVQRSSGDAALRTATVGTNENVERGTGILHDDPVAREILDRLIPLAQEAASAFAAFRAKDYESALDDNAVARPIRELGHACLDANRELMLNQHARDTGSGGEDADHWVAAGAAEILERAHSVAGRLQWTAYLQNALDSEQLTLLRQAISFAEGDHQGTVGTVFGLDPFVVRHDYKLTLREAVSWVTTPHEAIISYSNNIGMHYDKKISFGWLGGGVSLLLPKKLGEEVKEATQGAGDRAVDKAFGRDPDFEEQEVSKPDAGQFWLPRWFEDASITQFAVFAEAEMSHVLAEELPKVYAGVNVINFAHGPRHALAFDLSSETLTFDPKLKDLKAKTIRELGESMHDVYQQDEEGKDKLVTGELETDWDVLFKRAYDVESMYEVRGVDELKIDFGLHDPVPPGGSQWQPLVTAEIFFDTGETLIGPQGIEAIELAVRKVKEYLARDPKARLRFMVLGRSSKAWKHLQRGETAKVRNKELSEHRAFSVLGLLQQIRAEHLHLDATQTEDQAEGEEWDDAIGALGSDMEARWQGPSHFEIVKSRSRQRKGATDDDPRERGASIRIAVLPSPEEQPDPDAALKGRLDDSRAQVLNAILRTRAVLDRFFPG